MEQTQTKILFISKNIPIPTKRANQIILQLAKRLSVFYEISILYPSERVPWGLHFIPKYKPEYGLKSFNTDSFCVNVFKYPRLPIKGNNFFLFNKINSSIANFFLKGNFKLIHAHFLFPDGWYAYLLFRQFNTPYIITLRGSCLRYLDRITSHTSDYKKTLLILENAKKILVLNKVQKDFFEKELNINCQIIPHGIEESFFFDSNPSEEEKLIKIVSIGEALEQKNIHWVIKGIKEYKGEKSIQLDIFGDGTYLEELKKIAKGATNIRFHGRVSRDVIQTILQETHIFAMPSKNETFGLVFLEAAATHNLIIAKKYDGIWGVFSEEEMFFCEDYESFKELLYTSIEETDLRNEMANLAFIKAKSFTWDNILKKYIDIYKEALNS